MATDKEIKEVIIFQSHFVFASIIFVDEDDFLAGRLILLCESLIFMKTAETRTGYFNEYRASRVSRVIDFSFQ